MAGFLGLLGKRVTGSERQKPSMRIGDIKWIRVFICGIGFLLVFSCQVQGEGDYHLLGLGGGSVGILDDKKVAFGSLEYRPGFEFHHVKPWLNIYFAKDLLYTAAGLLMDLKISDNLIFTPSLGVGIYSKDRIVDLGHELEFQSAAEISYRLNNSGRLGLCFGHISNSSISERNPGTELLKVVYFMPLGLK